jgi:hypothetical protein
MALLHQLQQYRSEIESRVNPIQKINVVVNEDWSIRLLRNDGTEKVYTPTPFFKEFYLSRKYVNLVMGPYSSGKTVGLMMIKFLNAINMPPCKDGVRRSRTIITRTTYSKLWSSIINTFLDWFGDFADPAPGDLKTFIQKPYPIFKARFYDQKGPIEWEVYFMAFEKEKDVDKLGSCEFTDGLVNELRDYPKSLFDAIQGRIGRYPMVDDVGTDDYPRALDCDTNPPPNTHWIKKQFEDEKPDSFGFYKQQPGVIKDANNKWIENPLRDNPYNSKDYYLHLIAGKTIEFINVYARGEYGLAFEGKPVFPEYNDDIHSVDTIDYTPGSPLYLGWDFGLTPCLVIVQFVNGQLRVIQEFITESFGIENLIFDCVKPYWSQMNLKDYRIAFSDADPAGNARSAKNIDEPTLIQTICDNFTYTEAALSNKEEPRLEAVRGFLNRMSGGKPSFLISKKGCPILREGMNGKYYLGERTIPGKGEKMTTSTPVKTHPHSEPQDCLQYIAMRINNFGLYNDKPSAEEVDILRAARN